MNGYSKDPNLETLKDFPYREVLFYFGLNFLVSYAVALSCPSIFASYGGMEGQADSLVLLTQNITNVSDYLSIASVSGSPINSLSTALSDVPSLVPTESLLPELARSIDLNNLVKTQQIYQRLLNGLDPNMLNYSVFKTFLIHAKGSYFKTLEAGLVAGTPEFNLYLSSSIKNDSMLVAYLNHHNFTVD